MQTSSKTLFDLERKFWQSMVENDTDTALELLCEPAMMVSAHGALQFDHAGYRKMADHGTMVVTAFELSDMNAVFPNDDTAILTYRVRQEVAKRDGGERTTQNMLASSVWIRSKGNWRCAMHTETPAPTSSAR